jgi:hypothetical protein
MRKSDITCPECGAGYRRIELISGSSDRGEFRCLVCDHLLETFHDSRTVALRLTVQPERHARLSQHMRRPRMPAPVLMAPGRFAKFLAGLGTLSYLTLSVGFGGREMVRDWTGDP